MVKRPGLEKILSILIVIESIAVIIWLIAIPTDPGNDFFLGLSFRRWAMLFFPTALCVIMSYYLLNWRNNPAGLSKYFQSIYSFFFFTFFLLLSLIGLIVAIVYKDGMVRGIMARLTPLLLLSFVVCLEIIIWQVHKSNGEILNSSKKFFQLQSNRFTQNIQKGFFSAINWFDNPIRIFVLVILWGIIPLFYNALTYKIPLGYGGLYALMSESIVNNGFLLPSSVPFYGPGGLPFMYPPFGFYLMAVTSNIFGISAWNYLRFSPPIFSALSLIPLYLFSQKLTNTRVVASTCVVIVAYSVDVYMVHTVAAGMVRALAFLLVMSALFFYLEAIQEDKDIYYVFASIFFGLTILTHWLYAVFFVISTTIMGISTFRWQTILKSLVMGLGSLLIVAPWLGLMLHNYGFPFLISPFQSHGNDYFLTS